MCSKIQGCIPALTKGRYLLRSPALPCSPERSPALSPDVSSSSLFGGLVSAPKPRIIQHSHPDRAWHSCCALQGIDTYTPSLPTRAWIWQQSGLTLQPLCTAGLAKPVLCQEHHPPRLARDERTRAQPSPSRSPGREARFQAG